MLSPPRWRRIASWICGWLYLVGNITITLAVNFGTALFIVSCVNVFESSPGVGVMSGEAYQVFLVFLALTFLCNAISSLGNKYLPWIDVCLNLPSLCVKRKIVADTFLKRPPLSSGLLPVLLLLSFLFLPLPRTDAVMLAGSLDISRPTLAGPRAGHSVLVFSTLPTLLLPLA